jgi:acyl-CoA hydrolase
LAAHFAQLRGEKILNGLASFFDNSHGKYRSWLKSYTRSAGSSQEIEATSSLYIPALALTH